MEIIMKHTREKCAEAGREVRRIQREYLREVAGEMKNALEKCENIVGMARLQGKLDGNALSPVNDAIIEARQALEKARRLGL